MTRRRKKLPATAMSDPELWRRRLQQAGKPPPATAPQQRVLVLLAEGWRIEFNPCAQPHQRRSHGTSWRCRLCTDDESQRLTERTFEALRQGEHVVRLDIDGFIEVWGLPTEREPFDSKRVWRHFDSGEEADS